VAAPYSFTYRWQEATSPVKRRPSIVELVGPPAAGKSTVAKTLFRYNSDVRVLGIPYVRSSRDVPFFAANIPLLLPTLLQLRRQAGRKWLTPWDIALMTILQGWPRELERLATRGGKAIILEEGAVNLLAKLLFWGAEPLRGEDATRWWDKIYRRWAGTLDMVILLEAPIPTVLKRIRRRGGKQYDINEMTDAEAMKHLARIVESQRLALSTLTAIPGGPRILRVNSEDRTWDQIDFLTRCFEGNNNYSSCAGFNGG
jgi:hypothetical protein